MDGGVGTAGWPPLTVSRAGGRRVIQLIAPADDGLIHDDNDFRTPLRKITCPTCVEATLQSRTRRRLDAFRKREGARKMAAHSRLIAEAYAPRPDERRPHPEWAGPGREPDEEFAATLDRAQENGLITGEEPGAALLPRAGAPGGWAGCWRRGPHGPGSRGRWNASTAAGQGDAAAERAGPKFFAGNAFSPVTRTVAALLPEENSLDV